MSEKTMVDVYKADVELAAKRIEQRRNFISAWTGLFVGLVSVGAWLLGRYELKLLEAKAGAR